MPIISLNAGNNSIPIFATQDSGQRAWQVMLKDGDLTWTDGNENFEVTSTAPTRRTDVA